ncbi:MAG: Gfo/Idh/MocA family oxidoreductase [Phycisphaerales bacterium]|nr:MAG: Gfo/Idh/MocA family oxidoreductase [Phycisphaerales bacterium]
MTVPYFASASALGRAGSAAASERITMGVVGLGSMGLRHVKGFLQEGDCRIVAVCDVDAKRRASAAREINQHYDGNDCVAYNDFRNLLQHGDIDTLCIAVPDHWHALAALAGIRAGKDIYGEKPLALTIAQGRAIVDAVDRYECVWQTGSWQRSTQHFRFGCELVRNGRIGKLLRVDVGIGPGFTPLGQGTVDRITPQPTERRQGSTMTCGSVRPRGPPIRRCAATGTSAGSWTIRVDRLQTGARTTSTLPIGAWAATTQVRSK